MTAEKPENVREEIEALCPCSNNSRNANSACLLAGRCACYFGKVECRWPGHALALRLAERVERLEADKSLLSYQLQMFNQPAPDWALRIAELEKERDEARRELAKWEQENR